MCNAKNNVGVLYILFWHPEEKKRRVVLCLIEILINERNDYHILYILSKKKTWIIIRRLIKIFYF